MSGIHAREGKRVEETRNRIAALDGFRGIAILLVIAFHLVEDGPVVGGSYGVTAFFVLSGFLITTILMDRGSLRSFYARRATRLLPPLLLVVATFLYLGGSWNRAWPSIFYMANFERMGRDLWPLNHTWSLAIEEHFYLLWPLVVLAVKRRRVAVFGVALGLATLWRVWTMDAGFTRVYYGTDTNAFALIAGCLLAAIHRNRPLQAGRFDRWALPGLLAASFAIPHGSTAYLWGGFLVVALTLMIIRAALSGWPLLEIRSLRWLGVVSYGLYLWHPVMFSAFGFNAVGLIATTVVTAFSWYLIEKPMLQRQHKSRLESEARAVPSPG